MTKRDNKEERVVYLVVASRDVRVATGQGHRGARLGRGAVAPVHGGVVGAANVKGQGDRLTWCGRSPQTAESCEG